MKLSVITPSLNQAEFLPATLDSVRLAAEAARPHEIEHIVVDGGSQDRTLDILGKQKFAKWVSEPDAGQSDAINKGLEMASGDILSYLCSDDLVETHCYRTVIEAFMERPEAGVVYGDYFFLEGDSGWKRPKKAGKFSLGRLHRGNFISQPATFWARRVHGQFGGFDTGLKFCMDHEYWLRIAPHVRWHYIPRALATMRLHADAKTTRAIASMWWESAAMQKRYLNGPQPWLRAAAMQIFGQHYYRLKRRFFHAVGSAIAH